MILAFLSEQIWCLLGWFSGPVIGWGDGRWTPVSFTCIALVLGPHLTQHIPCFTVFQLYSSMDFGRRWQLMHERITPNRFYW